VKRAYGPTKTKIYSTNNGTKENKEGTGCPSESGPTEKLAAQRSKAMEPKVSLHDGDGNDGSTNGIEEAEASGQTTDDEEGAGDPIQQGFETKISTSY
jgi:hypothetical protein